MDRTAAGKPVSNTPRIPIENVYFLFCYAWNRFEEAQSIPIGGTPSPDLPNLLGRVLLHGARALLRRGLDRNYRDVAEEIPTVRGHIDLGTSLRLRAKNVRRTHEANLESEEKACTLRWGTMKQRMYQ